MLERKSMTTMQCGVNTQENRQQPQRRKPRKWPRNLAEDLSLSIGIARTEHNQEIVMRFLVHTTLQKINSKGEAMNVIIKADDENNAEKFWAEFDKKFPEIAEQARKGPVSVDVGTWAEIQNIKGFCDGPPYAMNAMVEVDRKTFWKGETYKKGGLHKTNFPPRATKEEAFADAVDYLLDADEEPAAAEWLGDEDYAVNTGNFYTKEEW